MTRHLDQVIRGKVIAASTAVDDAAITIRGHRIETVQPFVHWRAAHPELAAPPFSGTILPGLVDIHNHGGFGCRFDTVDGAHARTAAESHHASGSTTVVASVVAGPVATMAAQIAVLRELAEEGVLGGIHAEGPFLSAARCGAQDPRFLCDPDRASTDRILDAGGAHLRVMTLAPERPGASAVAARLADHGVVVALGHTDADYSGFRDAAPPNGRGTLVTHLANGMPPLHHRAPGPVAAALVAAAAGAMVVELIGDGVHIDPGFAALVFATAPGRVALVSDAIAAVGREDGTYQLGARPVTVRDGVARTADGTIAGGTYTLLQCVRWLVSECGISEREAVLAATATPAEALGLADVGDLRPGGFADLVIADDDLRLRRVLRRGQWLW